MRREDKRERGENEFEFVLSFHLSKEKIEFPFSIFHLLRETSNFQTFGRARESGDETGAEARQED